MLATRQSFSLWSYRPPAPTSAAFYRRPPLALLHSLPTDKPKVVDSFSTLRNVKVLLSEDPDCDGFLQWLEKKAGVKVSSVLSIGKSNHGRALFASRFIRSGDPLLRVPYSVQLSPENILPEVKPLLGGDVGNIAKLAIVVLTEQRKGQDSEWAAYIASLPHPGEIQSTIFWDEDELEMIKPSFVYHTTINQKAQNLKDFMAVKPVLDCFPSLFEDCTLEDFTNAYALVGSRAWGSMKGLSLIPFADFLNHDGTSGSVVLSDDLKQISEVIAYRNYIPGEEILIRYGKFPNSTLLADFGFTMPYNIHDQVQIQMDIPEHDHLRSTKLEILHRHHLPAIKDASFNSSGGSFLIKELSSTKGKGKGIPQSLRAFARVLCCTSPEELHALVKEAAETDGRLARAPLTRSREIEAHQMLLSKIDELIEEYKASIKSLRLSVLKRNDNKLHVRKQMALDLHVGELRVLTSASEWLKNYCLTNKKQSYSTSKFLHTDASA